ncbi:oxalurate catabolism protein HpxZ [Piscinibacter sp. XHJ-5]|uniref:oxalurate catabolism protein HpxZ n=1 Tax=Piscinibacter sp. XHJ-5 TaxID=3037797 RepID=UPI00245304E9|nr:oxalurate catabolism protein HpxZ [Piscinibacter sp. XHJ-5]
MTLHDVDRPQVLAEVRRVFADYERALMANDVEALNAFFWADERTTRYGIADRQWGIAELAAFRAATPAPTFTRTLLNPRITAYGDGFAVAQVEFVRSDTPLRGFQTQTWVRFAEGWKIVAAHVSMIAFDETR